MEGRDCKTSEDMYGVIEQIKEGYTLDFVKDDTPDRIIGFMNECQREINDYCYDNDSIMWELSKHKHSLTIKIDKIERDKKRYKHFKEERLSREGK